MPSVPLRVLSDYLSSSRCQVIQRVSTNVPVQHAQADGVREIEFLELSHQFVARPAPVRGVSALVPPVESFGI